MLCMVLKCAIVGMPMLTDTVSSSFGNHHHFPDTQGMRAGVSESIIMGMPMPTGTGLFKLRHNTVEHVLPPPQPLPLLAF